jgi:hypothetical protein
MMNANDATQIAETATRNARKGTKQAHRNAVHAHLYAAKLQREAGDDSKALYHENRANVHAEQLALMKS